MNKFKALFFSCAFLIAPLSLHAQEAPTYTGFDHVEIAVADITRARDFYAKVFGAEVYKDKASEQRYLHVGESHVALVAANDPGVAHISLKVEGFNADATQRWLQRQGIPWLADAARDDLLVADRDGIRTQLAPDTLWEHISGEDASREAAADPAPVFTAYAIDEVFLMVRNLEVDSLFYSRLLDRTGTLQAGSLWYQVGTASRLRLTQAPVGQLPGVTYFAVHVAYTDTEAAAEAVFAAGGIIENILPNGFSFWDPDGIRVVVRTGDLY
jgi:catechol 2,3-dioxygenase-like lactoylglutathione lyase family enzyme